MVQLTTTWTKIISISIALLVLTFIGILLRWYFRRREKKVTIITAEPSTKTLPPGKVILLETPKPSPDHKALIDFIALNKKHSIKNAVIREKLLAVGWLTEVIDVYLNHA